MGTVLINLTPFVPPTFTYSASPVTNITPFTYRDGLTYLEVLMEFRNYIEAVLVPSVESHINGLEGAWDTNINELQTYVDTLAANLVTFVNEAVDSILNSSVSVQDAVTRDLIEDVDSLSRVALNNLYQEKNTVADSAVEEHISNSLSETRTTLDGLYQADGTVSDTALETLVNDVMSATRVALDTIYQAAGSADDDAVSALIDNATSATRISLNALYQVKDTVADSAVAGRLRGNGIHAVTNTESQVEVQRLNSKRAAAGILVEYGSRTDQTGTVYYYTKISNQTYGHAMPNVLRHEYGGNLQSTWVPGTPGLPTMEHPLTVVRRRKSTILVNGAGVSQSGGDIGQIAGASWCDGVMYQGMSMSHVKHMECIGFDDMGIARVYSMPDGDTDADMAADNVQDAWGFGPILIKNGVARNLAISPTWSAQAVWMTTRSARTILGQASNGSVIIALVEGESSVSGIYGSELVSLAQALGMYNAVCLDGGGSSQAIVEGFFAHPSSDAGGVRNHGDFVAFNGNVVMKANTPWRALDLVSPFTGTLDWSVSEGKEVWVRGSVQGSIADGTTTTVTDSLIPTGWRPITHAGRLPVYFTGGYMGIANIMPDGSVSILNRTGAARSGALFNGPAYRLGFA